MKLCWLFALSLCAVYAKPRAPSHSLRYGVHDARECGQARSHLGGRSHARRPGRTRALQVEGRKPSWQTAHRHARVAYARLPAGPRPREYHVLKRELGLIQSFIINCICNCYIVFKYCTSYSLLLSFSLLSLLCFCIPNLLPSSL